MDYLLSIAIPTYNRAELLIDTVKCFANQIGDLTNVQIAISDNNSDDETKMMVSQLSEKYDFIKYHCNKVC